MVHIRGKLSLLAQFDDLVRCSEQLTTGVEDEFLTFVKNQLEFKKKWTNTLEAYDRLQAEFNKAKEENHLAETKLKHMKSLLETEMQKRLKIENEKRSLERQIAIIKEVLLADQNALNGQAKEKLAFLSCNTTSAAPKSSPHWLETIEESMGSVLSSSDVSFDKTDDFEASGDNYAVIEKRRSRSKRTSSRVCDDDNTSKKVKLQVEDITVDIIEEPVRERRSDTFSEKNTPLRRRASSMGRMNRGHVFATKTVIRPETCLPCGKRIKFYKPALKCQDCRATCHPECKDSVPLPCIPTVQTPGKGSSGTISDYVSTSPPLIPAFIIHCIKEIERRGLNEVGLYRVSGSEREVKDLKDKIMKGKSVPCMSKQDIFALCSAVKEFLRSLREPLVTRKLWKKFVTASELCDSEEASKEVCKAIGFLPQANRDTLAFLILHLHKIASEPNCKMPIDNLAKVFGPTIVGYSSAEPTDSDMISETKCQFEVMKLLLEVPKSFWEQFVAGIDDEVSVTPEPRPEPRGNLLGPLSGSGYRSSSQSRGVIVGKTPLTPRVTTTTRSVKTRQFFSSPLIK